MVNEEMEGIEKYRACFALPGDTGKELNWPEDLTRTV